MKSIFLLLSILLYTSLQAVEKDVFNEAVRNAVVRQMKAYQNLH